jgi:hypothetical protein
MPTTGLKQALVPTPSFEPDLKLDNVIVVNKVFKLADFGLTCHLTEQTQKIPRGGHKKCSDYAGGTIKYWDPMLIYHKVATLRYAMIGY